jgi:DNA polymerase III gamma/tau subunit
MGKMDNSAMSIWTEKYRPQKLDDLCISDNVRYTIKGFGGNMPNLLFCGIQGTGKTTLARILVQDILKCDYLYINASDESGVDTIRNKVTGFSQTKSIDGNIKVVILDEADFLSGASQAALRNLMESYSKSTRFILTGNYRHKIIPALQSRCQSIEILPSLKDSVIRCLKILISEGVETNREQKNQVALLVKQYFPDLRKCINELQKHCIGGVISIDVKKNNSELCDIIFEGIVSKKSLITRKYLIENEGIFNSDWDQILVDLLNHIYTLPIEDSKKKAMIITIADHLDKATRVNDKEINFFACLLNLED